MDIDLTLLRALEREKEISFDILIDALEQALLTAYHKTPGAHEQAKAVVDRKTGRVTVLARGLLVGGQQGLLDGLDQDVEGDLLLALQRPQDGHVDVHALSSPSGRRPGRRGPDAG